MRTIEELEHLWSQVAAPPRDRGTVDLIVLRPAEGERETPESVELSPQGGVHGDRWSQGEEPHPEAQVTLMNARVADLIADGVDRALFGDNFLVDLDLSEDALPPGTRLRLGGALVEITPLPHTGCEAFSERFGNEALRWVNHKKRRGQRLRGLHTRVIEAGSVAIGDAIEVVSRPEVAGGAAGEIATPKSAAGDAAEA